MLRQGFDERNAEGPNVFLGGNGGGLHLGGVVNVAAAKKLAPVADGEDRVARKLQAVVRGENIRRLKMPVNEALAVKVDEDIEGRVEDVAHFFRIESALRQNLAEVFLGVLHDRIDEWQIF